MITEVIVPKAEMDMEEAKIVQWLKSPGEEVRRDDPVVLIETAKTQMEVAAFGDGVIRKIFVDEGRTVPVLTVLALIGDADEDIDSYRPSSPQPDTVAADAAAKPESEEQQKPSDPERGRAQDAPRASPRARRLAREIGVDLSRVEGTGPRGRITEADVQRVSMAAASTSPATSSEQGEKIPHTSMRKTIARRMSESKRTAPHFYVTMEADMTAAMDARKALARDEEKAPSFTALTVRAAAQALKVHPRVSMKWADDGLITPTGIHIGVAVDLEDGLMAPVIRDADRRTAKELGGEIEHLSERARMGRLTPESMAGACFTVSNLGMLGVDEFAAIIAPGESAILALGTIREVPAVVEGRVEVRKRMRMTLSSDHRVIDGALGARFLGEVKKLLEDREFLAGGIAV